MRLTMFFCILSGAPEAISRLGLDTTKKKAKNSTLVGIIK